MNRKRSKEGEPAQPNNYITREELNVESKEVNDLFSSVLEILELQGITLIKLGERINELCELTDSKLIYRRALSRRRVLSH